MELPNSGYAVSEIGLAVDLRGGVTTYTPRGPAIEDVFLKGRHTLSGGTGVRLYPFDRAQDFNSVVHRKLTSGVACHRLRQPWIVR